MLFCTNRLVCHFVNQSAHNFYWGNVEPALSNIAGPTYIVLTFSKIGRNACVGERGLLISPVMGSRDRDLGLETVLRTKTCGLGLECCGLALDLGLKGEVLIMSVWSR